MIDGWRARTGSGLSALALGLALASCGGDAGLNVDSPTTCGGGGGPQVRGTVRMPDGRVAHAPAAWERVAAALAARAGALTGDASPVGADVEVQLVELRQEDVVAHRQPGVIATAETDEFGAYCMGLVPGTDQNVCRYVLQVGSAEDGTQTRAFVFDTDDPIDIDYRSEAAVRVILAEIPPASLCSFSADEIRAIYAAVVGAPGEVTGANAAEMNAVAASLAAANPDVAAAIDEALEATPGPPGTRTATPTQTGMRPTRTPRTHTPTFTAIVGPTRTRTPAGTNTIAPTNTAAPTNTPQPATATNTVAPTNTRVPATATVTPTRPTATATVPPTATSVPPTSTPLPPSPTPTATATPAPSLGERVFTIRKESQFPPIPGQDPRVGFFTSALGGFSVTNRFTEGPLILVAGAPDANGIAPIRLKEDVYFAYNIPPGSLALCWKLVAENSSGFIDCNGGTAVGVELVEAAGDVPPASPVTGKGLDGGPGALQLNVRQAVAEIAPFDPVTFEPTEACNADTEGFSQLNNVVFTTGNYFVKKGVATLSKDGENFDCANWTETDGVGMILTGITGFDPRSGNAANATRLADQ